MESKVEINLYFKFYFIFKFRPKKPEYINIILNVLSNYTSKFEIKISNWKKTIYF